MENLNIFFSYGRKGRQHENDLTKAYLTLFNYSKLVQIQLINLIRSKLIEANALSIPGSPMEEPMLIKEVKTQVSTKILKDYGGCLLSILISDEHLKEDLDLKESERKGILDGFIVTGNKWIFVIENKPDIDDVWFGQLSFPVPENVTIEKRIISLRWRDIISGLSILIENQIASYIESKLIEDFLEYIFENFESLNPYDNLRLCRDNRLLLEQRCYLLLKDIQLGSVRKHKAWHFVIELNNPYLKQITIYPEFRQYAHDWLIVLQLYPGDIMSLSNELYKKIDPSKVSSLLENNWIIRPNFHFSFRSQGILYTKVDSDIHSYIEFWINEIKNTPLKQIKKSDWGDYLNKLMDNKIMNEDDIDKFNKEIRSKNYEKLNVCPGICVSYQFNKEEALELGDNNELIGSIRVKLSEGFRKLNLGTLS